MHDRDGIANITDALVFIIILTVLASLLVIPADDGGSEVDIEVVHEMLLSTEISLDRLVPGTYGVMPLHRLLTSSQVNATVYNDILDLCELLMISLTPKGFKASWSIVCEDAVHMIGQEIPDPQIKSSKQILDGQQSRLAFSLT